MQDTSGAWAAMAEAKSLRTLQGTLEAAGGPLIISQRTTMSSGKLCPVGVQFSRLAAGGVVGVGEFHEFDGRAVFYDEGYADAGGWAVGRNQDFAAGWVGCIGQFKRSGFYKYSRSASAGRS